VSRPPVRETDQALLLPEFYRCEMTVSPPECGLLVTVGVQWELAGGMWSGRQGRGMICGAREHGDYWRAVRSYTLASMKR
jgi:hypothetical protein